MSKELIKQKLIEHLKLYGFEYSWGKDESGNRVNIINEDGTLSFDIPVKFYSINDTNDLGEGEYELHIQDNTSRTSLGKIKIVVYWTGGNEREITDEYIVCSENIDFIEEIPFAINKVLCSLASMNFKLEWNNIMVDVENYINYITKSKNTNIDSRSTDFIKEKIKLFIHSPYHQ